MSIFITESAIKPDWTRIVGSTGWIGLTGGSTVKKIFVDICLYISYVTFENKYTSVKIIT